MPIRVIVVVLINEMPQGMPGHGQTGPYRDYVAAETKLTLSHRCILVGGWLHSQAGEQGAGLMHRPP